MEYLVSVGKVELLGSCMFKLSQVGRIDSLLAEIRKYDRQYVVPTGDIQRHVQSAMLHVCRTWSWLSLSSGDNLVLLDPKSALESMDMSKSPGYPWRSMARSKDDLMLVAPSILWKRVDAIWSALRAESDEVNGLWFSFLKEELRPLEKLHRPVPAIRSISGGPVDLSIVGNQLCHDFNERFYTFSEECTFGSVVGISPFHGGWDRLCRRHWHDPSHPRMNSASIDITQWDRSFSPYLFSVVVEVRRLISVMHGDEALRDAAQVLPCLYKDVVQSAVVVPLRECAKVVLLRAGMKSGWVNTTTDNTLGHIIVLLTFMFYHGLADEIGRGVCFSLYGDDNLLSWSDEFDSLFTPARIEDWYRQWGFETHGVLIARGPDRYKQVFLGGSFAICPKTGTYVYKPEFGQKAIDAVRYGFKDHNVAFQRVCSLRALHYYNEDTYRVLDGYARFLAREQLVSRELLPNYLDDYSIVALHTGRESSDGCLNVPSCNDVLSLFQ